MSVAQEVATIHGDWANWNNFDIVSYAKHGRIVLCSRDGEPVGVMLSRLYSSVFDPNVKILRQDLLYARPQTRAARLLLAEHIDFGKAHANHIYSTIGPKTNIKSRSLERLGFNKLETLYRMEI